jgi:hypothetical protein
VSYCVLEELDAQMKRGLGALRCINKPHKLGDLRGVMYCDRYYREL